MANDMEESRTASLGRKRRNNQDAVTTAPQPDKRRKVTDNVDYIALDSSSDSDDAPAHARSREEPITVSSDDEDDRESGEITSSKSNSRRSSRASVPNASSSAQHAPISGTEIPEQPVTNNATQEWIDVDLIFPDNLRGFVRKQMKKPHRPSALDVLNSLTKPNQEHRKAAQSFLNCWRNGYRDTLGEYRWKPLQALVQDPTLFDEPFSMELLPRRSGKKIKGVGKVGDAFVDQVQGREEQMSAARLLQLIRMPQCHVEACKLLHRYINDHRKIADGVFKDGRDHAPDVRMTSNAADIDEHRRMAEGNHEDGSEHAPVVRMTSEAADVAPKLVSDLSPEDQALQHRYFHLSGTDPIRCLSCGGSGHEKVACPANTCEHCTSTKHFSRMCPLNNEPDDAKLSEPPCRLCKDRWHATAWCSSIWTTFKPSRDAVRKIPPEHMSVTCYNCGGNGGRGKPHWGDDCPDLPNFLAQLIVFDTWSAKNANSYIVRDDESSMDEREVEDEGRVNGGGSVPAYQLEQAAAWY